MVGGGSPSTGRRCSLLEKRPDWRLSGSSKRGRLSKLPNKECLAAETEMNAERLERKRLEQEHVEQERIIAKQAAEAERVEQERISVDQAAEAEWLGQERIAAEAAESAPKEGWGGDDEMGAATAMYATVLESSGDEVDTILSDSPEATASGGTAAEQWVQPEQRAKIAGSVAMSRCGHDQRLLQRRKPSPILAFTPFARQRRRRWEELWAD